MAEISQQVEIPNRALFKAAEVCDLAKLQPYVLRSWEAEFKDLGIAKGASGTRVYRREDVERVLRIKHLLLIEGLTLAGVRRRLEEEAEPPLDDDPIVPAQMPMSADARARIGDVRRGLRSLLDLLDAPASAPGPGAAEEGGASAPTTAAEFALAPPSNDLPVETKVARRSASPGDSTKSASPRRKRSA